jgi:hypothetical protein
MASRKTWKLRELFLAGFIRSEISIAASIFRRPPEK